MSRSGVESVRFTRRLAQHPALSLVRAGARRTAKGRYRNEGGVPTNWFDSDRLVRAAAQRGLRPLLTILYPPSWGSQYPGRRHSPPGACTSYARFAALVVRRYGPAGNLLGREPDACARCRCASGRSSTRSTTPSTGTCPGSDPNNIDNTGSAPGLRRAAARDPAGDQGGRSPRSDRLRGHRQQGVALPEGDLPGGGQAAVRRLRRAPVHRRAAQRHHHPALRAARDEPQRRPAQADVRHRVVVALLPGPGRRPGQAEPHPRRPGARDHRDAAAASCAGAGACG